MYIGSGFSLSITQHIGNVSSFLGLNLFQFIQQQHGIVMFTGQRLKGVARCFPALQHVLVAIYAGSHGLSLGLACAALTTEMETAIFQFQGIKEWPG